jgi:hypothetical protein
MCENLWAVLAFLAVASATTGAPPSTAGPGADGGSCAGTRNSTHVCLAARVDLFAGEAGYFEFAGVAGVSPTLEVRVGQTLVLEQYDATNWYHPLGFAYFPDGAHGADWGGEEQPEVEGLDQLQYFVDGAPACGPGDIGLDCYEPAFFLPRADWRARQYRVELTITRELADASLGGELFYFCHIHSKMSGRIVLLEANGTRVRGQGQAVPLYEPAVADPVDQVCGTFGLAPYAPGRERACSERFVCGAIDTTLEKCLQAMDCQMNREMRVAGHDDHGDPLATFCQQMIPHHVNAVNMARLLLKLEPAHLAGTEFEDLLHGESGCGSVCVCALWLAGRPGKGGGRGRWVFCAGWALRWLGFALAGLCAGRGGRGRRGYGGLCVALSCPWGEGGRGRLLSWAGEG